MGFKKKIIAVLSILLVLLTSVLVHKVYAAKATISLNSPVSFPVDI
jgi:hypothetical protein